MSLRADLDKMTRGLTAYERAVLILRAWKAKETEDPLWRHTMPQAQVAEFNRYINLLNACNMQIAFMITVIEKEVEKLQMKWAWLLTLEMWQLNLAEIDYLAAIVARETVTQTSHDALVAQQADDYVTVGNLAREVAGWERAWSDDDLHQLGSWPDNLVVKDDVWERLCKEAEGRLREAVEAGELKAKGTGARLKIRWGSFDALLGRAPSAMPAWAAAYDVVPNERAAQAAADRTTLKHLRDAIERSPMERMADGPSLAQAIEDVRESLMFGISMRWLDICELETVLREVAEDFGGEDPLKLVLREVLEKSKQELEELHASVES
jgi:hypothetical protein